MVPIVSFVGKSDSGKTTLLEKVVRELKLRSYRVAVIKHTPHGFDIDQPGKDSWRLTQAGSDVTVISSPTKLALLEHAKQEIPLEQIAAILADRVDVVLAEGYKNSNTAKILILGIEQEKLCRNEDILATVSVRLSSLGMPEFGHDDIASIVNLVIDQISENSPPRFGDVPKIAAVSF